MGLADDEEDGDDDGEDDEGGVRRCWRRDVSLATDDVRSASLFGEIGVDYARD